MSLINEELINILRKKTSEKENTVDLLMDIIPLGKEAAYRRLRGEILFTMDEAAAICKQLNISLDTLIGTKHDNVYAFHMSPIYSEDPMGEYCKMMNQIVQSVNYVKNDPVSFSLRAYRSIPQEFMFRYESLARIHIYVLYYQLYIQSTPKRILEIGIPDEIFTVQKESANIMHMIDSILILDKRMFIDFIEIIQYFHGLGVVTHNDITEIKKDMHLMVNDLENCASSGLSLHGKKLDIYISHVSFDCTYSHLESSDFEACSVGVYCIDHLSCCMPEICEKHKLWIRSLIRFSTLISVSGELQRNEFFNKQRNLIDTML